MNKPPKLSAVLQKYWLNGDARLHKQYDSLQELWCCCDDIANEAFESQRCIHQVGLQGVSVRLMSKTVMARMARVNKQLEVVEKALEKLIKVNADLSHTVQSEQNAIEEKLY